MLSRPGKSPAAERGGINSERTRCRRRQAQKGRHTNELRRAQGSPRELDEPAGRPPLPTLVESSFALALGGAGKQQIRDIGARDQQDSSYGSHEHQQQGTRPAGELVAQTDQIRALAGVRFRVLFLDLAVKHIHIAGGLGQIHAIAQATDKEEAMSGMVDSFLGSQDQRQEEIGGTSEEEMEASGHDSDNLIRLVIEADGPAQATRASPPKCDCQNA